MKEKKIYYVEGIPVDIIPCKRKSMGIKIDEKLNVSVRFPYYMSYKSAYKFADDQKEWIVSHYEKMKAKAKEYEDNKEEPYTEEDLKWMTEEAKKMIPPLVEKYAALMGVTYGRVTIRHQKSRWGSCSAKGNLNFNCLLMLTPPECVEYVVVHELCHRKYMNHSRAFWAEVAKYQPDYRKNEEWLKTKGKYIIDALD
jgi:predicted metal-dependent hydrolase